MFSKRKLKKRYLPSEEKMVLQLLNKKSLRNTCAFAVAVLWVKRSPRKRKDLCSNPNRNRPKFEKSGRESCTAKHLAIGVNIGDDQYKWMPRFTGGVAR